MDQIQALQARLAQLIEQAGAITQAAETEDRDPTEEEQTQHAALLEQVKAIKARIARLEEQAALEAELDARQPVASRGERGRGAGAGDPGAGAGTAHPRPGGDPAAREFESFGQFMHAVRFNQQDPRLSFHEGVGEAQAEQSMGDGSSGGFAVPEQWRGTLMEVSAQDGAIRPRATVIPAGSPPDAAITMPALDQSGAAPSNVHGGVTVEWIAEGATKPETDADLREIKLEPQEVAGHVIVSDKLLRNWQAAGPMLERLLRGAVMSAEDLAFLNGSGIGKPLGVIPAGATYDVARATASTFTYPDLANMLARLLMRGGMPLWLISPSVMPQLLNMKNEIGSPPTGDGSLIWQPNARDSANNQLLMGYPIRWNERSPALGTKGDVVLADLSYYLIKDGSGPFVNASEHVYFTTNKTVIKIFWNVDGQPWLTEPFTNEGGYDVSPFVALDVPA